MREFPMKKQDIELCPLCDMNPVSRNVKLVYDEEFQITKICNQCYVKGRVFLISEVDEK